MAVEPVFYVKGNAYDAYRSEGHKNGTVFNSVPLVVDAGYLSGGYFDFSDTGATKGICYSGMANTSRTRAQSFVFRFAPTYTGAPTATRVFYTLTGGAGNQGLFLELRHTATTGTILITLRNENNVAVLNAASFGAWTAGVANTLYDFTLLLTGDTTANGAKLYIGTTLQGQLTQSAALSSSWNETYWKSICLGMGSNSVVVVSAHRLDEFAAYNGLVDPSAIDLMSGVGSLGTARTSPLYALPFNGPPQISMNRIANR